MPAPQNASAHARSNIARLFVDLRTALRATPHQVAAQLRTRPDIILALEAGQFEGLPTWNETARIVIGYTALAGIDGRPVLTAIADVVRSGVRSPVHPMIAAQQQAYAQPSHAPQAIQVPQPTYAHDYPPEVIQAPKPPLSRFGVGKLMQAGSAIASGAKWLQGGAFQHVRRRPERALYAVSLPLGIVLILFNTTALEAAFSHVPRPVARMTQDVRQYFQERFAPVREGLRWIEVDDPRRRRGDKLR
ncbi:MAG TPA: helix-turn-helix domain-containing protein [Hyphomicrobium sp.]|nr:helix-turn-helix domain-containing protein [Hyphomicrobium sp.]